MWPVLLGKGRGLQPQRRVRSDDQDTSVCANHLAADRMAISQEPPVHPVSAPSWHILRSPNPKVPMFSGHQIHGAQLSQA